MSLKMLLLIICCIFLLFISGSVILSDNPLPATSSISIVKYGLTDVTRTNESYIANNYLNKTKEIKFKTPLNASGEMIIMTDGEEIYRTAQGITTRKSDTDPRYLIRIDRPIKSKIQDQSKGDLIFWNVSQTTFENYRWGVWDAYENKQTLNIYHFGFECDNLSICNFKFNFSMSKDHNQIGAVYLFSPSENKSLTFKIKGINQTFNFSEEYPINMTDAQEIVTFYHDGMPYINDLTDLGGNVTDLSMKMIAEVVNLTGNMTLILGIENMQEYNKNEFFVIDPETTLWEEIDYFKLTNYPSSLHGNTKDYFIDKIGGNIVSNFNPDIYGGQEYAIVEFVIDINGAQYNYSEYDKQWHNITTDLGGNITRVELIGEFETNGLLFQGYHSLTGNDEMLLNNISVNSTDNVNIYVVHKNISIAFTEENDVIDYGIQEELLRNNLSLSIENLSFFNLYDEIFWTDIQVKWSNDYSLNINGSDDSYNSLVSLVSNNNQLIFNWTDSQIGIGANQNGLAYHISSRICKTGDYVYIAYAPSRLGGGQNLTLARSQDGGVTFDNYVVIDYKTSNHVFSPNVLCDESLVRLVYINSSNSHIVERNSSDKGGSFIDSVELMPIGFQRVAKTIDCEYDSNLIYHCIWGTTFDTSHEAVYFNSSEWGYNSALGTSSDDADHCSIIVDNENSPHIFCSGTDADDVTYSSPRTSGWGTTNGIHVLQGSVYSIGDAPTSSVTSDGIMVVATTIDSQFAVCNTTISNYATWECYINTTNTTTMPSISMTDNGDIWLFMTTSLIYGVTERIIRWNTSLRNDFWDYSEMNIATQYGIFVESLHPTIMKPECSMPYIFMNSSANSFHYESLPIGCIGDTCTILCDGTNHEINCTDNCNTTVNCDMQGGNITATGDGQWTITANITNWKRFDVLNSCKVKIYEGAKVR